MTEAFTANHQRSRNSHPVGRPRLLVTTSTYPRWVNDPEPAFVHELCKRLVDRFDVAVLCPHADGALAEEQFDGVSVYRYRYAPRSLETLVNDGGVLANLRRHPWKWLLVPGFLVGQWLSLYRLCRRWRPDLVHAHWLVPQGVIAWLAVVRPLVVTSHGADLFALKGHMFSALRAKVARFASAITVVSEVMRERLQQECPSARTFVMPMGVDLWGRFREDADTPRSANVILAVGRLVEKKGLIYLIEAMPRVLEAYPQARLDIVGFGPERDALVARTQQLGLTGTVRFLGARPQAELPQHYRSAALFVAPFVEATGGDQEGLGLVVAEAVGCLCPILVGDVPAVHDLLDGERNCVVPQRDAGALADAIVRVLRNPDAARSQALARQDVLRQKFSWEAVADRYLELFEGLVRNGRPP